MTDERRDVAKEATRDRLFGGALLAAGVVIAGLALSQIGHGDAVFAQAAQPNGSSDEIAPAKPGGTRPTTPAPEPARPEATPNATTGSSPSTSDGPPSTQNRPPEIGKPLPQAPAEQVAPPMK
jgi:hypothetical protein